jgi:hypothetical protein
MPQNPLPALTLPALALLCVFSGCERPAAQPTSPATAAAPSASSVGVSHVNPAGPVFFEVRDVKPSYHVALTRGDAEGALTLSIKPVGAYKINKDYPAAFAVDGGETYESEKFQISDKAATLSISGVTPDKAQGEVRFSVCTPEHCDMHKVRVGAPAGAAPAPKPAKGTEATL